MLVNMSLQGMYSSSAPLQGLRVHQHFQVGISPSPFTSVERGSAQRVSLLYASSKSRCRHARTPTVCCIAHQNRPHAHPSKAVVIGGGMAGLASASSLSSIFDEVVLLERDTIATDLEVRSSCFGSCARSAAQQIFCGADHHQ